MLRALIDLVVAADADPAAARTTPAGTLSFVELSGGPASRLAAEDRAALVQNAVLNEGKEPARAEFETGALIDLLAQLERARIETRVDPAAFRVELEIALTPPLHGTAQDAGAGQ
jgi:hypothetical protein